MTIHNPLTVDQWHALRGRLYAVLAVLGPLLAFYGVVSSAEYALWVGVVTAALGNGLAATNVVLQRRGGRRFVGAVGQVDLPHDADCHAAYRAAMLEVVEGFKALSPVRFEVKGSDLVAVIDRHKRDTGR